MLLFVKPLSAPFFVLYALCGVSDMLDGFFARRLRVESRAGRTLDSAADLVFIAAALYIFIPLLKPEAWILVWVAAVAAVKLTTLGVGIVKFRALPFLHTYANKATGFLLFCFPALYAASGLDFTAALLCFAASLAAAEELFITLKSKSLDANVKTAFVKSHNNEKIS